MIDFAEQAAIQWSLEKREQDPYMISATSMLIKVHTQFPFTDRDIVQMGLFMKCVLYHEAQRDIDETFCKRLVKVMVKFDWEEYKESF